MFQKTVIDRYLSQQDKELVAARYEANQKLFGEDRGLLPANSSLSILHDWKTLQKMGYGQPLYEFFKNFFRRIDSGYVNEDDHTKDVFAYNGGPHGRRNQCTRLPASRSLSRPGTAQRFVHAAGSVSGNIEGDIDKAEFLEPFVYFKASSFFHKLSEFIRRQFYPCE